MSGPHDPQARGPAAPALSLEAQWWDWVSCSASGTYSGVLVSVGEREARSTFPRGSPPFLSRLTEVSAGLTPPRLTRMAARLYPHQLHHCRDLTQTWGPGKDAWLWTG